MSTHDIDDLFRSELDGHTTPPPPGDALWARLQANAAPEVPADNAERLDRLFQKTLAAHATPPARELWERLEDEHLRPRKRRAAAWWPMALAAALALFLVAGGAGLWLGLPWQTSQRGTVAVGPQAGSQPANQQESSSQRSESATGAAPSRLATAATVASTARAREAAAGTVPTAILAQSEKNVSPQATRSQELASTSPKARMSAAEPATRALRGSQRQPDAATNSSLPVALTTPAATSAPKLPAADERQNSSDSRPVVAQNQPNPVPATLADEPTTASGLASAGELITVDVRNGGAPQSSTSQVSSLAQASAEAPERLRLGGRLLQQAGHLMRGERLSLAEVTGLSETVTVRATVAGRSLTKSIQL